MNASKKAQQIIKNIRWKNNIYTLLTKPLSFFLFSLLIISFIDIANIDNHVYQFFCLIISRIGFQTYCIRYYDISIWDFLITVGTLSAGYFAYQAIKESNIRLDIEQSPYVVFSDRILTNTSNQLHVISIKNIGRGSAMYIRATSDPEGKISIIESSNPHSIDLAQGQHNNGWAVNEAQVREGLEIQGKAIDSTVLESIPDENTIKDKNQADFYLYLRYKDQLNNEYITQGKFRHSGFFLKLMENKVKRIEKK